MKSKQAETIQEAEVVNQPQSSEETGQANESDRTVLLGSISYNNVQDYERFLEKLDMNQAIFILIAGCNYAQSRGILNMEESELISKSIRTLKKNSSTEE